MAEKRIITEELIENYHKAVINFNENIKKEKKYRQTLCENFIFQWADVIDRKSVV